MTCLVLRLAGAMQSWGTQSRFGERDTGREPSKSGVIGLLCATLGRDRAEPLDDLRALKMGVRVDREGLVMRDFHTAGGGVFNGSPYGVAKASGAKGSTVLSNRFYLAAAEFHVALEGDPNLLMTLRESIHNPVWPIFLGRKACPPDPPLCLGLREGSVGEVLKALPWIFRSNDRQHSQPPRLRLVLECAPDEGTARMDVPLSFQPRHFTIRHVRMDYCEGFPVVIKQSEEFFPCISQG